MMNVSTMINSRTFNSIENILDKSSFRSNPIDRDLMLYKSCINTVSLLYRRKGDKDIHDVILESMKDSRYVAISNPTTVITVVPVIINNEEIGEKITSVYNYNRDNLINNNNIDGKERHTLITMITDGSTILSLAFGLLQLFLVNYGGAESFTRWRWDNKSSIRDLFKSICTIYWIFKDNSCYLNDGTGISNNKELVTALIEKFIDVKTEEIGEPDDEIVNLYANIVYKFFSAYYICTSDDIINLVDLGGIDILLEDIYDEFYEKEESKDGEESE